MLIWTEKQNGADKHVIASNTGEFLADVNWELRRLKVAVRYSLTLSDNSYLHGQMGSNGQYM